jgi:hypothetical protein
LHLFSSHRFGFTIALLGCLLAITLSSVALATDLPTGLLRTLRAMDPMVQIRADGQATLTDGTRYIPVLPQAWISRAALSPAQQRKQAVETLTETIPAKVSRPDLLRFNNQAYLLRLIPTTTGKVTFVRLGAYPVSLKEGLLPQDWILPNNLSIPAELKILLGSLKSSVLTPVVTLPQRPKMVTLQPPGSVVAKVSSSGATSSSPVLTAYSIQPPAIAQDGSHPIPRSLYVADLSDPRLLVIDPLTGATKTTVQLGCVPSRMLASANGERLYVACLSSDQLVVVDTRANLIRTRLPVGSKPGALLLVQRPNVAVQQDNPIAPVAKKALLSFGQKSHPAPTPSEGLSGTSFVAEPTATVSNASWVLVSNRFSRQLSLINPEDPDTSTTIELPGPGGVMTLLPDQQTVLVADAVASKVYVVSLSKLKTIQTLPAIPAISAIWYVDRAKTQTINGVTLSAQAMGPTMPTTPTLFMASRTMNNVVAVDLSAGSVIKTFEVGEKPTAFAVYQNQLLTLSGQSDRLDIINWKTMAPEGSIALEAGSFPSDMTMGPDGKTLFISAANSSRWFTVDCANGRQDRSVSVAGRGVGIALVTPQATTRNNNPTQQQPFNVVRLPYVNTNGKFVAESTAALMLKESPSVFSFTELKDPTGSLPTNDVNTPLKSSAKGRKHLSNGRPNGGLFR